MMCSFVVVVEGQTGGVGRETWKSLEGLAKFPNRVVSKRLQVGEAIGNEDYRPMLELGIKEL